MNPVTQNIIIGASGVAITVALIAWVTAHFKLFKLKAEIQEDLANTYTPEILGASIEKKEGDDNAGEQEGKTEKAEASEES
ncbi:MAG: hypothetical protein NC489_20915 [Ruminococcus flavefaciens]|nr:hypothetical protein [Ruminococcus flavefaciens]